MAVLSITAAGQGITLTAASIVIFAEIYWIPGALMQVRWRLLGWVTVDELGDVSALMGMDK